MLPLTIIRPAEFYQHGDAVDASEGTATDMDIDEDVPAGIDEEDPPDTGGAAGSGGSSPRTEAVGDGGRLPPAGLAESGDAETKKKRYFKTDAIGRTYEYDEHGNRVFKTPLHGSFRPPTIP